MSSVTEQQTPAHEKKKFIEQIKKSEDLLLSVAFPMQTSIFVLT